MSVPVIRLLVSACCPNADLARERLVAALNARGIADDHIREIDMDSPGCPPTYRNLGSPTILIGEEDVSNAGPSIADGPNCRIYPDGSGAPLVDDIATALDRWFDARVKD